MTNSIKRAPVTKINQSEALDTTDALAIEEPLEIRLEYGAQNDRKVQNVSVTMRTPGNDMELAAGFLFTEGIIQNKENISNINHCFIACAENKENVIQVSLNEEVIPNLRNTERNFYTTSSCGVCGKGSINAIRTVSSFAGQTDNLTVTSELLYELTNILQQHQEVFADTGGLHASALFNTNGELMLVREDVGRHNALDKLIGAALGIKQKTTRHAEFISASHRTSSQHDVNLADEVLKQVQHDSLGPSLPLNNYILLLSGRASFELVQKAAMAGINMIAAVGAPSSLAVELAAEFNITLAGFLRNRRFNIYTAGHRIVIPIHENTY